VTQPDVVIYCGDCYEPATRHEHPDKTLYCCPTCRTVVARLLPNTETSTQ
jgi:Zn finger protein HypA/HybF involved in hydrogenase expression